MRIKLFLITILSVLTYLSNGQQARETCTSLSIEELVKNADQFENKKVKVIGLVAHICGVDGKKMKIKSPSGAIVKVVTNSSEEIFDSALKKQLVVVQGLVVISRITKAEIDKVEEQGTLLCHIDNSPCKDKEWVNKKIESGTDVKIAKRDIANLRQIMQETGKDYVTTVSIRSENVNVLD